MPVPVRLLSAEKYRKPPYVDQPALGASMLVLAMLLLSRPFAETGMVDDWSYIKSAQQLAETGHIHYNGWAAPMLGWVLYPAALLIHLFGFSFTVVRLETVGVAVLCTYVLGVICRLCGLTWRNSLIVTLAVMLSPCVFPLCVTYMTDIPGFFVLLVCFACCLQAVQPQARRPEMWIAAAALSSALGGTVRQTSWLGLFVAVPLTLWFLRGNRRALVAGIVSLVLGALFVPLSLRWLSHQPYTLAEPLFGAALPAVEVGKRLCDFLLRILFYLVPISCAFLPMMFQTRRSRQFSLVCVACVGGVLLFGVGRYILRAHLAPFMQGISGLSATGSALDAAPVADRGDRPETFPLAVRVLFTVLTAGGALGTVLFMMERSPVAEGMLKRSRLLPALGVAFLCTYSLALLPRAAVGLLFARYAIPLLPVVALGLGLTYQSHFGDLPWRSVLLTAIFAFCSVCFTHDQFARYRGLLTLAGEAERAGVPRTAIDGQMDFNGWTEIAVRGHVLSPLARTKETVRLPAPHVCLVNFAEDFPSVDPAYAVAFSSKACAGPTPFQPVAVHTWLPYGNESMYLVRDPVRQ